MESFDSSAGEIVDAIDRLRSSIETLEMRVSSLEGSVGHTGGGSSGAIEQRLDQIARTVEAIRREMF